VLRLFHRLKLTFTITLTIWVTFDVPLGDAAVRFVKLKSFDCTQQFIISIDKLCGALGLVTPHFTRDGANLS
jgi:hypothetical protein